MQRVRVLDSHTEGEPTRVVLEGAPDLGAGSAAQRQRRFGQEHDSFRTAVCLEPRGSDVLVGALLLPPEGPAAVAQVLFFNNAGYLGMCGHGTIGVAATLAHLGRIGPGTHRIETTAGDVGFTLHADRRVTVANVRSYRTEQDVAVETETHGVVRGDVAWGGNWFFLVRDPQCTVHLDRLRELEALAGDVRRSLVRAGIRGDDGAEIDHVELFGPPQREGADSKSFVLCPGFAYDRSPCGTGTSAKLACLAADGKLEPERTWVQESVIGSTFEARYRPAPEGGILPEITGRAWITAESTLLLDPSDPFRDGIRP